MSRSTSFKFCQKTLSLVLVKKLLNILLRSSCVRNNRKSAHSHRWVFLCFKTWSFTFKKRSFTTKNLRRSNKCEKNWSVFCCWDSLSYAIEGKYDGKGILVRKIVATFRRFFPKFTKLCDFVVYIGSFSKGKCSLIVVRNVDFVKNILEIKTPPYCTRFYRKYIYNSIQIPFRIFFNGTVSILQYVVPYTVL